MMRKWAPEADLAVYAHFRNYLISEACESDAEVGSRSRFSGIRQVRNYLISEACENDAEVGSGGGFSGIRPVL